MKSNIGVGDRFGAGAALHDGLKADLELRGGYEIVCRDKHGREKWRDRIENLVTNAGEDHALDVTLSAATQTTTWYVMLIDGTPTVAEGDTSSSHAGWTEITSYDEAARVTWSDGGVSGQSVDNSGSTADFTMNSDGTTVGGAALIADNTKGGSTGVLYSAGAFTGGDKSVDSGDTLSVTATFTAGGS